MGNTTSHVRQYQGQIRTTEVVQHRNPPQTFQPIDPPRVSESPELIVHNDGWIEKVAIKAKTVGTTDTVFELQLNGEDLLNGYGLLPPETTYNEFYLVPAVYVLAITDVLMVNITAVGTGVRGLVIQVVFT